MFFLESNCSIAFHGSWLTYFSNFKGNKLKAKKDSLKVFKFRQPPTFVDVRKILGALFGKVSVDLPGCSPVVGFFYVHSSRPAKKSANKLNSSNFHSINRYLPSHHSISGRGHFRANHSVVKIWRLKCGK